MKLQKAEMTKKIAEEIVGWNYEPPYDFYNNDSSETEIAELLNGTYYAVMSEDEETVGFFCVGKNAQVPSGKHYGVYEDSYIDMGLGMNPQLVGKGNGAKFVLFVLHFIEETHQELPVRLTVAAFNKRAIHLYRKLGFVLNKQFNTDSTSFFTMVKIC